MSVSFVLYVSWMELQVPLPVLQQSRVTRLGGLPLSLGPLYPLSNSPTHTPYSQFRSIKSRLCACFITSLPFRLLRIYHVSSNSSNWKAFSAPVRKCKSCALLSQTQKRVGEKQKGSVIATSSMQKSGRPQNLRYIETVWVNLNRRSMDLPWLWNEVRLRCAEPVTCRCANDSSEIGSLSNVGSTSQRLRQKAGKWFKCRA